MAGDEYECPVDRYRSKQQMVHKTSLMVYLACFTGFQFTGFQTSGGTAAISFDRVYRFFRHLAGARAKNDMYSCVYQGVTCWLEIRSSRVYGKKCVLLSTCWNSLLETNSMGK